MKTALITGISGQDGAYLAKLLLDKGYKVVGTSRQSSRSRFPKLTYLGVQKKVKLVQNDLLDAGKVRKLFEKFQPDEIYNLAAQSSVDFSFKEPEATLRYNILSVLNMLEASRTVSPKSRFYQATTCEIFGNKNHLPIKEDSVLDPSSPYGVSKAVGHLMVKDYREVYGLFCVSGIMFNHESHLRNPNYFIRRLIRTAIAIAKGADEYVYLGQADNKRDFGYSPEYVKAMWLMLQNPAPKDYIICSGKSISIMDITKYVLKKFDVPAKRIKIDKKLFRQPNIKDLYGDNSRAKQELGWKYKMDFYKVLDILIEEELNAKERIF